MLSLYLYFNFIFFQKYMKYRYNPLIKYIILYCVTFLFVFHSKILSVQKNMNLTFIFVLFAIILDYLFIQDEDLLKYIKADDTVDKEVDKFIKVLHKHRRRD